MPEFSYIAQNIDGKKITGQRDAASSDALAEQLQMESLIPLEVTSLKPAIKTIKAPSFKLPKFFEPKIPQKELQMFCRQMYTLLKAGIPIITT